MANFAEISDLEAFLQIAIDTPEKVASAERALTAATAAIRNYTEQRLSLVEDDVIVLDSAGQSRLLLPELPVLAVVSVKEDGQTLVAGRDYKLGQFGLLYRMGRGWKAGIQVIEVTYSHGYSEIPTDIKDIATRAAARVFQAGLRAAEQEGVLGVSSKALGDFSVSFVSESGGGVGEGLMGASAARPLLLSEKDILNRYRP